MTKMTYEELVQALLDRVKNDVDKREGSVIFDAIAPCAYFLTQMGFQLDNFLDLVLPDTAVGEYLDRAVGGWGIIRKPATAAVRKVETSASVPVGSLWGINELVYRIERMDSTNVYHAICTTAGDKGNQYSGQLQPITNGIVGITANLTDIITPGTDTESDEALRQRFYVKAQLPVTSGNANHYIQWALEVPGTGAAKAIPLDGGPGTVTVLVVNDKKAISSGIVPKVQSYIDTVRPIGATVTVQSPQALTINVTANILLDKSRTASEIKQDFEAALDEFLKDMIFENYRVSYAKIGNLLLDIPGVEDFDTLLINGKNGNVMIGAKQIPVNGTVSLSEVSMVGTD